jgi:methylated-DNA-[protein]-cysteine S-methyltransferase
MTEPAASAARTPSARAHTVVDSPCGPLTLVAEGDRLVGLYMVEQRHRPDESGFGERLPGPTREPFTETARQLQEYFEGRRESFDLPLKLNGTPFQQRVWAALLEIPCGATWTYGELAEHIGQPTASRAVGLANGKNPISVIVPCHRVVGANGGLIGYGGGLERKLVLLEHERPRQSAGPAFQQTLAF